MSKGYDEAKLVSRAKKDLARNGGWLMNLCAPSIDGRVVEHEGKVHVVLLTEHAVASPHPLVLAVYRYYPKTHTIWRLTEHDLIR